MDDTVSLTPESLCERIVGGCTDTAYPGVPVGLIVVDDLECLRLADDTQDDSVLAGSALQMLSDVAKAQKLAVIVTVPVLRHTEERAIHIPKLKDLWGNGPTEQVSDVVIAVFRPCYYEPDCDEPDTAILFILKNRWGTSGAIRCGFANGHFSDTPVWKPSE